MKLPPWHRHARRASRPTGVLPGPDAVEIGPRSLRVGGGVCRTLAVVGYPRQVAPGWLEPLLTHPAAADIAVHVDPVPAPVAAERLRRQLARLESSRRLDSDKGRLADPELEVATADAHDLASRLARGEGRLYRVGLYVTVRGRDAEELDAETDRLRALLASLLLEAYPATFRMLQGWITTLPLGLDNLGLRRTFDTDALAASFPFASAELPAPTTGSTGGVLYGHNTKTHGLVLWDRFACENYNQVILAKSGAGKSYLAKLELLRWLYRGVQVAVIDPEDEYRRLADAVGGTYLRLGAPGVRLNPFDLDLDVHAGADALTRRALFVHTLISVLLREPFDPAATAALDRRSLPPTPPRASPPTRAPTSAPRQCSATLPPPFRQTPTRPPAPWPPGSCRSPPGRIGACSTGQPPPTPTGTCWCSRSANSPRS
jgi:hypothetical protein